MKVVILGPLPPPFGGVSVHIVRFREVMAAAGLTSRVVDYTGTTCRSRHRKALEAFRKLLGVYFGIRPNRGDVLHIHYSGLGYFLALVPLLRCPWGRKVITFHSVRVIHDLEGKPGFLRGFVLRMIKGFDLLVPVREGIATEMAGLLTGPDVVVMPAFLPPADEELNLSRLAPELASRLERNLEAGRLQICCAAYNLGPGYGKEDVYGIEELTSALAQVSERVPQPLDLWIMVSNRPESQLQQEAEARILEAKSGTGDLKISLCYGQPVIPVLARCAGLIRLSREDGDSVVIREGLSLGVPVLASDVIYRPPGVGTIPLTEAAGIAQHVLEFVEGLEPMKPGAVRGIDRRDQGNARAFANRVVGMSDQTADQTRPGPR